MSVKLLKRSLFVSSLFVTKFTSTTTTVHMAPATEPSPSQPSNDNDNKDNDVTNLFNKIISSGKEAINSIDPELANKLDSFIPNDFAAISEKTFAFIDSGAAGKVGYGFLMGYCSGFCIRKVSRVAGMLVGGIFIIMQTLSYNGYLVVNYKKLQDDIEGKLDINNDGKLDMEDVKAFYEKAHTTLSYNMPTGGGFTVGFITGLRTV